MSYELAEAHVADMRAQVWTLTLGNIYRRCDPASGEGGIPGNEFSTGTRSDGGTDRSVPSGGFRDTSSVMQLEKSNKLAIERNM